jgi:hypothetical protein
MYSSNCERGRCGRDRMVVGFTTIYAISRSYHHWCCGVWISIVARCTTLSDKVCQWLSTGKWFTPSPPVSSTNKTDRHDITEILLNVALNTIKQTNKPTVNACNHSLIYEIMIENKLLDEIARKSGIQDTKQSLLSEINRQSRERRWSRNLTDYKKIYNQGTVFIYL